MEIGGPPLSGIASCRGIKAYPSQAQNRANRHPLALPRERFSGPARRASLEDMSDRTATIGYIMIFFDLFACRQFDTLVRDTEFP